VKENKFDGSIPKPAKDGLMIRETPCAGLEGGEWSTDWAIATDDNERANNEKQVMAAIAGRDENKCMYTHHNSPTTNEWRGDDSYKINDSLSMGSRKEGPRP
jgi:hypothetical protein